MKKYFLTLTLLVFAMAAFAADAVSVCHSLAIERAAFQIEIEHKGV